MSRTNPPPAVLVVDDDTIARAGVTDVLGRQGYTVVPAANGGEALAYLRGHPPPALVILDMLMPVLDGWHFLQVLRSEAALVGVPILVATGTILTREWAAAHGCAGFLRKPYTPEELIAEVSRCVGETPGEAPATPSAPS